jgi:lipoyl(octanoyl) transferase
MRQWRLMHDMATLGAHNMAVDEAIMRAVARGEQPPTLRLYAWQPPCLSLGYGQRAGDVDWAALAAHGYDCVRRTTGGRAILHTDELTYSLALPMEHPLALHDVMESYREISRALLAALQLLGAQPRSERMAEGVKATDPVCFETPSHYEITVDGKKLIGSAQARRGGGVLQHGTLPLTGDIARICNVLVYESEAARESAKAHVRARATTLGEALGAEVTWDEAAASVVNGFAQTFDITFVAGELSTSELDEVARLTRDTYANDEWTLRR